MRQQLRDPLPLGGALGEVVRLDRLGDDRADRHPRVERAVRVLEDDLHPAPRPSQVVGFDSSPRSTPSNADASRWSPRAAGSSPGRSCSCRNPIRRPGRASRRGGHRTVTPSTALTVRLGRLEDPGPDREMDLDVVDLDEVGGIVRAEGGRSAAARSPSRDPAFGLGRPAARHVAGRRRGWSARAPSPDRRRGRTRQRGLKRQASAGEISNGGRPSIVRRRSPRTSSIRGSESSRPQA